MDAIIIFLFLVNIAMLLIMDSSSRKRVERIEDDNIKLLSRMILVENGCLESCRAQHEKNMERIRQIERDFVYVPKGKQGESKGFKTWHKEREH